MPAFKVLSEVSQPKRRFAKATIGTMIMIAVLFILANVAYVSQVLHDWGYSSYHYTVVRGTQGPNYGYRVRYGQCFLSKSFRG